MQKSQNTGKINQRRCKLMGCYFVLWYRKCNTKMSVLPRLIYKISAIPIKTQEHFFVNIDKIILKFIRKSKGS